MESQPRNILPHEIEVDILVRLPVKSLLRFRAVCKPWRSLILHPKFVRKHFHRTNDGHNIDGWRLSYAKFSSDQPPSGTLYSTDAKACDKQASVLLLGEKNIWGAYILYSYYGLLLMAADKSNDLFLWNPSTREYIKFSAPNVSKDCRPFWGLGYDSSSDDYKVLRAVHDMRSLRGYVELFSLNTNCWTEMKWGYFPYCSVCGGLGTIVNGSPHWSVRSLAAGFRVPPLMMQLIIYFDFREEKFKEIPAPPWFEYISTHLGVLGGCLSIVRRHDGRSYFDVSHFEVWAMKEYGVEESWTKLFSIRDSFKYLTPYCFTKNGEVLMTVDGKNSKKCVIYNLKERSYTIMAETDDWPFHVVIYAESLVSPMSRKELRQESSTEEEKDENKWVW